MLPLGLLWRQESKGSGTTSHIIFFPWLPPLICIPSSFMAMKKRWVWNKKLVLAYFFLYKTCQKQSFPVKQMGSLLAAGFSCRQHKDIFGGVGGGNHCWNVTIVLFLVMTLSSQALPSTLVFLCLLLFNSYISQTQVFISCHSSSTVKCPEGRNCFCHSAQT